MKYNNTFLSYNKNLITNNKYLVKFIRYLKNEKLYHILSQERYMASSRKIPYKINSLLYVIDIPNKIISTEYDYKQYYDLHVYYVKNICNDVIEKVIPKLNTNYQNDTVVKKCIKKIKENINNDIKQRKFITNTYNNTIIDYVIKYKLCDNSSIAHNMLYNINVIEN